MKRISRMQSLVDGYPRFRAKRWNSSANSSGTSADSRAVHLPPNADEVGRAASDSDWAVSAVEAMVGRCRRAVALEYVRRIGELGQ